MLVVTVCNCSVFVFFIKLLKDPLDIGRESLFEFLLCQIITLEINVNYLSMIYSLNFVDFTQFYFVFT